MTMDATVDAVPDSAPHHPDNAARNRLVIAILLVSTFVVFLNETIMSVAIPHLMADLGVAASAAQWLTTAFLLTMAVVIPITGFLLQRLNTIDNAWIRSVREKVAEARMNCGRLP